MKTDTLKASRQLAKKNLITVFVIWLGLVVLVALFIAYAPVLSFLPAMVFGVYSVILLIAYMRYEDLHTGLEE